MKCIDIERQLEQLAPQSLAKGGRNNGLIIGRSDKNVSSIVVVYRVDQEAVDFAVTMQADMIISHEPVIREPLARIGSDTYQGRLLLRLLRHDIACYALSRSFDLCKGGTADWIAARLELTGIRDIDLPDSCGEKDICRGGGRMGNYKRARTLEEIGSRIAEVFEEESIGAYVPSGKEEAGYSDIAIIPEGEIPFLEAAMEQGAEMIVTCGIEYETGIRLCREQKTVLELSRKTEEAAFCDSVEQYLSEVVSSSVNILTAPGRKEYQRIRLRKEKI